MEDVENGTTGETQFFYSYLNGDSVVFVHHDPHSLNHLRRPLAFQGILSPILRSAISTLDV